MQAKIDDLEQYLNVDTCVKKFRGSRRSDQPTNNTSSEPRPPIPSRYTSAQSSSVAASSEGPIDITPSTRLYIPHQHSLVEKGASDRYPIVVDDEDRKDGQGAHVLANGSAMTILGETSSQTNLNGRKRSHDMILNASGPKASTATKMFNNSMRRAETAEEPWKEIITDMAELVEVYQEFAATNPSVDPREPSGSIQHLMTAFTAQALHECVQEAIHVLDCDIIDHLSIANRALRIQFYKAGNGPLPNEAQRRAAGKFLDEAIKYLSLWEQMTEGDAMSRDVKVQPSLDPNAVLEQFVQLALANGGVITVEVVEQYINAAQVCEAGDKLGHFLTKVKPLTEALIAAFEDLERLQE